MSPAAKALLALEFIQNRPGITAQELGDRLGVTERAARRYVGILREADLPIESVSGPHGGYRAGRGLRLPPLMFSAAEAMGLVMAVLEGHRYAADPGDLVGGALAKILRALPERVAGPVRAVRNAHASGAGEGMGVREHAYRVSPELTTQLIESCNAARRLRLKYGDAGHVMEFEPWAVVLRHSRWYLLGWSRTRDARRVLRVDRIAAIEVLPDSFVPPGDLDALRTLEEHLSQGWTYPVDVLVDAAVEETSRWVPRSLGRLEADGDDRTRLRATTDEPGWYARQLAAMPMSFQVLGGSELQRATVALGRRLTKSAPDENNGVGPAGEGTRPLCINGCETYASPHGTETAGRPLAGIGPSLRPRPPPRPTPRHPGPLHVTPAHSTSCRARRARSR
jgi:predicted DNA-binding transcriptional regulator YafY